MWSRVTAEGEEGVTPSLEGAPLAVEFADAARRGAVGEFEGDFGGMYGPLRVQAPVQLFGIGGVLEDAAENSVAIRPL